MIALARNIHLETIAEQVADRVGEVAVCRRERLHVRVFRQRLEQEQGCAHMEKGAGEVKASEENKLGLLSYSCIYRHAWLEGLGHIRKGIFLIQLGQ